MKKLNLLQSAALAGLLGALAWFGLIRLTVWLISLL